GLRCWRASSSWTASSAARNSYERTSASTYPRSPLQTRHRIGSRKTSTPVESCTLNSICAPWRPQYQQRRVDLRPVFTGAGLIRVVEQSESAERLLAGGPISLVLDPPTVATIAVKPAPGVGLAHARSGRRLSQF